jgi:hypothetical protein
MFTACEARLYPQITGGGQSNLISEVGINAIMPVRSWARTKEPHEHNIEP